MKRIYILVILLLLSISKIYSEENIIKVAIPKIIDDLRIYTIGFDSKLSDIEQLLKDYPNLAKIETYSGFDDFSPTISMNINASNIRAEDNFDNYLSRTTEFEFFNGKMETISIGLQNFLVPPPEEIELNNGVSNSDKILSKISSERFDINNFEKLKISDIIDAISSAYGADYFEEIDGSGMILKTSYNWIFGDYRITLSPLFLQIRFTNRKIKKASIKKHSQQKALIEKKLARLLEDRVAFRNAANLNSKVLVRLNKGEILNNIAPFDGPEIIGPWRALWYKVRRSNGQEGYVYGWFLEPVE